MMNMENKYLMRKQYIVVIVLMIISIGIIIFKIKSIDNSELKYDKLNSYVVTYNDNKYDIVPEDLINSKSIYKEVLDRYNMPYIINKTDVGELVAKFKEESKLYRVKEYKTNDILILTYLDEYVYAFSEKLIKK